MKINRFLPYVVAIIIFIAAAVIYFHPVLKGEKIAQSDITQFRGMSKEIVDYRVEKQTEPYWTNAAFSGMPAYQVSAYYPNDFVRSLDQVIRFLPRPADYVFLYFFGFFLLMISLKVPWKLSILGALCFGFSTYLIIIFVPGHNAKAHAIGYMPIVLAGVLWVFQKRYLLGFVVTGFAMALEVYTNHPQMTYYLGFCLLILGLVEFIEAIKKKTTPIFIKQSLVIVAALVLGIGANSSRLLAMKEYADFSTRGTSELTIQPDGSQKIASSGLDKAYITEYSYGIPETLNLLIPRFMGGGTVEQLGEDSNTFSFLENKIGKPQAKGFTEQVYTYWGNQPIVEAPAYIGAVLLFLFFLGIYLVKGPLKHWLVAATIFSIVMSWGKNFDVTTNFFINYVPLYNKFRAVSSIQVIAELCVPILAVLGLKSFFSNEILSKEKKKALQNAFYIVGGIALFFTLFGTSLFAFEGLRDAQYLNMESQYNLKGLLSAVIEDRKEMLFADSLRSLILIGIAFVLLWFLLTKKIKQTPVIFALGVLILFDLVSVDKRYVNEDDFKSARNVEQPFTASAADKVIMQDKGNYRVANFTGNPMQDGRTSYFHQSIGGYHAAKMRRYQELFDYQISNNNLEVLNMLNTKYFIISDENDAEQVQQNPETNGSAWFVNQMHYVHSADEEIRALDSLQTKNEAVINTFGKYAASLFSEIGENIEKDSTATISLIKNELTTLSYQSNAVKDQFAVFSEIYYRDGWNAYIDGKLTSHYRVNYVLRGMVIPAGTHLITFIFEPNVIEQGSRITLISYAFLFLIPVGWFFINKRKRNV
jgi:hypothetical protein